MHKSSKILKKIPLFRVRRTSTFNQFSIRKSTANPKKSMKKKLSPRSIKQLLEVLLMEKTHPANFTPTLRTKLRRKLPRQLVNSRINLTRQNHRWWPSSTTLVKYAQTFRSWRVSTSRSKVKYQITITSNWMRPPSLRLIIALLNFSSVLSISSNRCKMRTTTFRIWSDNSRTSKVKLMTPKMKNSTNYYLSKTSKTTSSLFRFSRSNRQKWEKLWRKRAKSAIGGIICDSPLKIDFRITLMPHNEHS